MSTGRLFDMGYSPEQRAAVAELILQSNAVAQIGALPSSDGFLIRVWPPNGTHEFGGNNMTVMSFVIRFDAKGKAIIEHLDLRSN